VKVAASISFGPSGVIPEGLLTAAKVHAQSAMAQVFYETVLENFGPGPGEDRPIVWRDLTEKYAEAKHQGDTTPTLILKGGLLDSVSMGDVFTEDHEAEARVYTDCPIASYHQYGVPANNLPPRPFFPMEGEEGNETITPQTEQKCLEAAAKAIADTFSRYFSS
jgi:phage gpG-like protein